MPWIKTVHLCDVPRIYPNGDVAYEVVDYDLPHRVGPGSVWECPDVDCKKQWRVNGGMRFEPVPSNLRLIEKEVS